MCVELFDKLKSTNGQLCFASNVFLAAKDGHTPNSHGSHAVDDFAEHPNQTAFN